MICASACVALVGALALASCAPQPKASNDAAEAAQPMGEASGGVMLQASYDPAGPIVRQLEDGRYVQLTPTDQPSYGSDVRTNIDVLKADARGCATCHLDLGATLESFDPTHAGLMGGLNMPMDVTQCKACHHDMSWVGVLGPKVHALHNVAMDGSSGPSCFTCHEVDSEGNMLLWEEVKHGAMAGITAVEDVQGDFVWDQEGISDGLPNINWLNKDYDQMRWDHYVNGDPLDQEMFDTWQISITGLVGEEKTWTLPELIEQAPSITTTLCQQCELNPLNGNLIGQAEVKGIPLDWVIEQAGGVTDGAVGLTTVSPDRAASQYYGTNLTDLEGHDALIVYEMNGEPLSWIDGYPAAIWIGGQVASRISKNFSEIIIDDVDYSTQGVGGDGMLQGWYKPNVGILNTVEGQVLQAGTPYTFEGWANAWELPMVAMEFSMDGGATWTRFDTPDATSDRWVHWQFTWTPEADADSAYVLMVRGVARNEDGTTTIFGNLDASVSEERQEVERRTEIPLEMLVNARADMNSIEVSE
ncbi:molybdopterin-dependent oxidoreductase [Adlercreutzia sp. R25]|uniref:molybdopterin-dependent oxidoreductase n=1 Tax=Adlercreutzia shanghongiae TaxID=3111773 RepID=UPI002DBBC6C0|nr:molybdopterin-dependent oxidoreductase [Adlercreutzia sp. R25]MEC4271891.1 molybdopterin-dependent oxidoreductase [Adlercreutzia sp. R25]